MAGGDKVRKCFLTGKLIHDSEPVALTFKKLLELYYKQEYDSLSPYLCNACSGWHLGRKENK